MRTPEGFEKDDICKFLVGLGAWHFRPFMSGYGKSGVPDIVACVPVMITADMVGMRVGVFTSIEIKREGKEPTKLQDTRINEIKDSGGFPCWGTAERVIPILKKLPYS
jgi:Holliday junction resolvase